MTSKQDPHRGWRKCEECGKPFIYWRETARFDTALCRVRASRKPKQQEVKA